MNPANLNRERQYTMTNTSIELSEEEFDDQFPLLVNHLNPNASWVHGEGPGCLFETYGEELDFVRQQDLATVWTLVNGDDGHQYLVSGFHFVNRIGYLVSTVPVPEGVHIEVRIPMQLETDHEPTDSVLAPSLPEEQLSSIAREHLDIPTLDTKGSDSLDFHDLAVWQIRSALQAAFDAGAGSGSVRAMPSLVPTPYDAYEIHVMKRLPAQGQEEEPVGPIIDGCEQVADEQAEFWSLFGHIPGQGIDCIGDFRTRQHAEEVFARITGHPFAQQTRRNRRTRA
jgi:hypothetical protein